MKNRRWWGAAALAMLLAACGGQDDKGSSRDDDDARNGDYTVYAADARSYTLALDFDRKSWRLRGDGVDQSGTFASETSGGFAFLPSSTATNTARFQSTTDTVLGGLRLPGGSVVPFVGARSFVTSTVEAVGVYHFVRRTVNDAGGATTDVVQGEITSGGQLRTCTDGTIQAIGSCPSGSVLTHTLTVSGSDFTAKVDDATFTFRIAKIGNERVLLRASASASGLRQFWLATPATSSFTSGQFVGANTDGQATTTSLSSTTHSATLLNAAGGSVTRSGTASAFGNAASGLASLLKLETTGGPTLYAIRNGALAAIVAAPDSSTGAGYLEIGRAQ